MTPAIAWVCCGVLRAEMESLLADGRIEGELRCLDSMLHMVPCRLEEVLTPSLDQARADGLTPVLVYGDCCPRMLDFAQREETGRTDTINCAQLLVGRERYRELMREQAFLFLPEWTGRWKEIIEQELGLSRQVAAGLMREHRGSLVYLDTGLAPIPRETLDACAAYTGLPWRAERVTLDHLLESLLAARAMALATRGESPP